MKDNGIVRGTEEQAKPLIVGATSVLVHTDIKKITVDSSLGNMYKLYEYHEYVYDKDEYIYSVLNKQQSDIDYIAMKSGIDI